MAPPVAHHTVMIYDWEWPFVQEIQEQLASIPNVYAIDSQRFLCLP